MDMLRVTGAKLPTGVYTDAKLFDSWATTIQLLLPEQPGAREGEAGSDGRLKADSRQRACTGARTRRICRRKALPVKYKWKGVS
jgi:hypothetical protein